MRVYRELKLGGSLKAMVDGSYKIDLERGAHKTCALSQSNRGGRGAHWGSTLIDRAVASRTASTFGPSRCTLPDGVAVCIQKLVSLDNLQEGEYLFHGTDRNAALEPPAWTRHVQAAFRQFSIGGVSLSPKNCRRSCTEPQTCSLGSAGLC